MKTMGIGIEMYGNPLDAEHGLWLEFPPDAAEIEKLGVIDHSEDPDNIGDVDEALLAKKVEEFEAKYGDRKRTE